MPKISLRGKRMPASPIRKLAPLADAARRKGINVFHLNIGQPDIATPDVALEAVRNIDRKILEYSPSEGQQKLRVAMSEYYQNFGINITENDIIVTTGGSEALLFAFQACLDAGDELIMTEPTYANYMSFAMSAGVVVKPVVSRIEDAFALPPIEAFEALITPQTKAILICNPNNPTGYVYTREEMDKIRDLVRKYDLFLISDEVYREFCYTETPHISAFHLDGIEDNVVMIDSVSKRYSECGIRIGMLITKNKAVQEAVLKLAQARLSPPLLGQIAATASFAHTPKGYMKAVYDEYIARRNFLIEEINKIPGVYSPMPKGAFYTIARFPVEDIDDFCAWLLSDFQYNGSTVMLAPATGFYTEKHNGNNEVRIAYVLEIDNLRKAIEVLRKALEAYPRKTQ
ncbi:MAG: pyridoxal phosphate-dependent aminotransferase [Prevotellaceae bacterium]|jgi:aspartate aminotransferase|nr:pyridoxal phosphate-dependent aminotransferase [Prevotellaceae bacterium]